MLIQRYVFREWLRTFLLVAVVTLAILLMEGMFRDLLTLFNLGAPAGKIFLYYLLFIPGLMPTVLPVAIFVSALFALGKLHKNQEITAMRAAGLGPAAIFKYLWAAGLGISLALLLLNAVIIPKTDDGAKQLFGQIREGRQGAGALKKINVTYDNRRDRRLWLIGELDLKTGQAGNVTEYGYGEGGEPQNRLVAKSGIFRDSWEFSNATLWKNGNSFGDAQPLHMETVAMPNWQEPPALMGTGLKRIKDLSLSELNKILSFMTKGDPVAAPYEVRRSTIFAGCCTPLLVILCAIPFAMGGVRTNPAIGASKAVGLLFLFYVFSNGFQILGSSNRLDPTLAAWTPNLLIASLGILFFRKLG